MKIIETKLIFRHLTRLSTVRRIIIHHSKSGDVSAAVIHRWHRFRGWAGIGYHYVVRQNGVIERGRPENMRGAHAGKANHDSIGICLVGNFEKYAPGDDQLESLGWLINDIQFRMPDQHIKVLRHRDVAPTACPGRLFPWHS